MAGTLSAGMEEIDETLSELAAGASAEMQRLIAAAGESEEAKLDEAWRELLEEALREA